MVSCIKEWRKTREIFCCKAMEVEDFSWQESIMSCGKAGYRDGCLMIFALQSYFIHSETNPFHRNQRTEC
jgi:hypothetical protein